MLVLAQDSFHRANQSPVIAPWVLASDGTGSDTNVQGQVNNNLYECSVNAAFAANVYDGGITFPNNQFVQATLRTLTRNSGYSGLLLRYGITTAASDRGYLMFIDTIDSNPPGGIGFNTDIRILFPSGVTSNVSRFLNAGDVFNFQVVGSVLRVYLNGVSILTAIDTQRVSGNPGIYAGPGNGVATDIGWDNWSAGSVQPTSSALIVSQPGASVVTAWPQIGSSQNLDLIQIVNDSGSILLNVDYLGELHKPALNPTTAGGVGVTRVNQFLTRLTDSASVSSLFADAFFNPSQLDILQVINPGGNVSYWLDYQGFAHGS